MKRLAKNLILATATIGAIFLVDFFDAEAASIRYEKNCPFGADNVEFCQSDFWGKFRDTVMPDPDKPQNNNPPKNIEKPKPAKKLPPRDNHSDHRH